MIASSKQIVVMALTLAVIAAGLFAAPATAAGCPRGWGSLPEGNARLGAGPLMDVRTGAHPCFDRIVFDVASSAAPGYTVGYITPPFTGIGGEPAFVVGGGAILEITINAPSYDQNNNRTLPYGAGHVIVRPDQFDGGFRTFEDLVYGGSFEGYTSFGLGVRARLPFRVLTLAGPDTSSRVVVDVAHHW
jgi:hypothetical protein